MKSLATVGLACATALVSVLILSYTFRTRARANDLVNVTGLAKRDFVSDLVVWKGHFVRRDASLKAASEGLRHDLDAVQKFCAAKGVKSAELSFAPVEIEKEFEERTDNSGRLVRTPKGFLLTQRLEIESKEVERIEAFSREVTSLIDAGIEFYSAPPEYYYTNLGELKLEMIAAATRDGRTRAERIVEAAGGRLGALHYSSLGVFQITQPNSSAEFSWSGAYDTRSKRKTASVTIKLQFGLR
jgi:uncharacterized protein